MYKNDIDIFLEENDFHKDLEASEKNLKLIEEWSAELPSTLEIDLNFELTTKSKEKKSLNIPFSEISTKKRKSNKHLF